MPHLTLEYSANLDSETDHQDLFSQFHHVMADVGKINIQNCKSRLYIADRFRVGRGIDNAGFVHLDVRFLAGRSELVCNDLGTHLLEILEFWFAKYSSKFDLQITVEIQDIVTGRYFKYPEGTFTKQ